MSFRTKNLLISFIFMFLCLIFLNISSFTGFVLYGTIFFMMLVSYFLVYWLFNFDVYPQGFITILLLPTLTFGSYMLIYYDFVKDLPLLYKVIFTAIFMFMQYYLVLTQNILNVSNFTNVGLSQAALVSNSFYTIWSFFLTNLAIFLIPDIFITVKLIITIPVFIIYYLIFTMVNSIDRYQFIFGGFFYLFIVLIYLVLYVVGFINPLSSLLLVISLAIVFRGITVVALYSFRRVISLFDFVQIFLESVLVGFLVYMTSL
jgi:hypothetical protein